MAENYYGQLFSEARLGLHDRQKFTLTLDAVLEAEKIGVSDILAVTKAEFTARDGHSGGWRIIFTDGALVSVAAKPAGDVSMVSCSYPGGTVTVKV